MRPYQNHATMQGHIAQWQASNLSQTGYCKEHGIKPHIFSYYKKKFSSDSAVAKHASQLVPVKLVADDASPGSNLLPVFLLSNEVQQNAVAWERQLNAMAH